MTPGNLRSRWRQQEDAITVAADADAEELRVSSAQFVALQRSGTYLNAIHSRSASNQNSESLPAGQPASSHFE
jgi:hypothetical protein